MKRGGVEGFERVRGAVALEKTDAVPVVIQLCKAGAMHLQGLTQAAGNDAHVALQAMVDTFRDFGGWDALYLDVPDTREMQQLMWGEPLRFKLPGVDIGENDVMQAFEQEVLLHEDYERILEEGWDKFYLDDYVYRISEGYKGKLEGIVNELDQLVEESTQKWNLAGAVNLYSCGAAHPFFTLSLSRSLVAFNNDLYTKQDIVERVIDRMTDDLIEKICGLAAADSNIHVQIAEERAEFYSPRIFDRFWWPYTKRMVSAFWEQGIVTWFHLDGDWVPKAKRFLELPARSFVLQLDSLTDMRKTKAIVGGHCALHGDVPPSLQSIGTPKEVYDYSSSLIRDVGQGGGLILGVGCEVAPDCKKENLAAILQAADETRIG
jgi:hypothetical protein